MPENLNEAKYYLVHADLFWGSYISGMKFCEACHQRREHHQDRLKCLFAPGLFTNGGERNWLDSHGWRYVATKDNDDGAGDRGVSTI
jgi:hypothetical protein